MMGNRIEHQFVCHLNPFPSECLSALGLPSHEPFGSLKAFHIVAVVLCHAQNTSDDFDLFNSVACFIFISVSGSSRKPSNMIYF